MLHGTVRDHATQKRRPFIRFFVCGEDWSHESPDTLLPDAVATGVEPFLIVGAIYRRWLGKYRDRQTDYGSYERMKTYIALFRSINVGGRHILPMKALAALLENLGAQDVKTYIQSGNVVFQHKVENDAQLSSRISAAIKENHGFEPQVLLLDLTDMEKAITSNPFPDAESEPKSLHLYFLTARPENPDLNMLDSLKKDNEQFKLLHNVFYLHAPDGIGRSKVAERVEKALGVVTTARNWRTVGKIMAMAKPDDGVG